MEKYARLAYLTRLAAGASLVLVGLGTTGGASDRGVEPRKLVVVGTSMSVGSGKTVFVTRDEEVSTEPAGDVEQISARVHLEYDDGRAAAAFLIPGGTGSGWERSRQTATLYHNWVAPGGPTQARTLVVRPRRFAKLFAVGTGDIPLDLQAAGAPTDGIFVSIEIVNAGRTTRLCSEVRNCTWSIQSAAGVKLICRGGAPDPACRAGHPVYIAGSAVRYGGPDTIAVIGDSITVQATTALEDAFVDGWFVYISAVQGAMFRDRQQAADAIARSDPQAVVLHLGTNDYACVLRNAFTPDTPCGYPDFDRNDLRADARAMVGAFASSCILGTTVAAGGPLNELWYELAASGELRGVVPWAEFLASLDADERSLLIADSLGHVTAAGAVALAELTRQSVDQACLGD